MACHKNMFSLLREITALAEEAWPSPNANTLLKTILHLAAQLIELRSSDKQAMSSPFESKEDKCTPQELVMKAREAGNSFQFNDQLARTHPTPGGGKIKEHDGKSLASIRSDWRYLKLFDKNALEKWEILQELFLSMDNNGDDFIDEDEFCLVVTSNLRVSRAEAKDYFQMLDKDSSGKISLSEFGNYIEVLKFKDPRARFMEIAGEDRIIDRRKWKKFCVCNNISTRRGEKIFEKMDGNRSGKVTYTEFDIYVNNELANEEKDYWFNSYDKVMRRIIMC